MHFTATDHPMDLTPMTPFDCTSVFSESLICGSGAADDLAEVTRVQKLLQDFPADMFKNQLLIDYSHSEPNLKRLRNLLYDIVKELDDVPFDRESDLKRRVNTRNGESVFVKLDSDIHAILCVMDGEDFALLKDVVSTSKRQNRRKSIRTLPVPPWTIRVADRRLTA